VVVLSHFRQAPQMKPWPFPFISMLPFGVTEPELPAAWRDGRLWAGFACGRLEVRVVSCERATESPGPIKGGRISQRDWLLLASQQGLCSRQLITVCLF
jgi:hypothetical protein